MKNWQKLIALFAIFMFSCSLVFAQVQIRGKVSDKDGTPLPGVNVVIEGTTTGTVTDIDGLFTIQAQVGQTLEVRFIGMKPQLIEIESSGTFLEITLEEDVTLLDEMVVVGYGTQKKESVVGAIGTASSEDLKSAGNQSNLKDALTGLIPGVSVLTLSGMPGGDPLTQGETGLNAHRPTEILIRGRTTWNDSEPLILVDGVERSMQEVDINEVESVSVLKDASATAVFGVKGGNGVILITTKRGTKGKAKFTVEAEMSLETPTKLIEREQSAEAAIARNYAAQRSRRFNSGVFSELFTSDQELEWYRNGQYPYAYANQNWENIMLKDLATSNRVSVTASGGTDNVKYFASAAYSHTGDIIRNDDIGIGYIPEFKYDRLNVRSNFDFQITKTTTLAADFSGVYGKQTTPSTTGLNGVFSMFTNTAPNSPIVRYEDGTPGARDDRFDTENPWNTYYYGGLESFPRTQVNMTYTLTQELDVITKGLSFSGKFAFDNTFRDTGAEIDAPDVITRAISKEFYLRGGYYDYEAETYMLDGSPVDMLAGGWALETKPFSGGFEGYDYTKQVITYNAPEVSLNNSQRNIYYQMMLNYGRSFNKHSITGMAMFSRQKTETGSQWPHKREDWVGRVTYDYNDRYLLEMNGAYNGSEKFGPEYRFDFFPSFAGGWVISNESFLKDKTDWLDKLKVRYSYGLVGNDNVNTGSTWPYLTIYGTWTPNNRGVEENYYGYPYGYQEYPRFEEGNPGNPNLRWEKAAKQNLGLEFAAFSNKLSITADVFKENREDMLIGAAQRRNTVPPIFGKPAPPANLGEAKSHGAELVVTYRNALKTNLGYFVTWNWSVARSEVVYQESTELTLPHQRPEGKPLEQTRSGISTGFIESWDDLYGSTGAADATSNSFLLPGDLTMLDFNGDGRYYGAEDNVPYGYPTYPQNNYGLHFGGNYKGFDLSMRFVGAYNATRRVGLNIFNSDNLFVPTDLLDNTWTPEYNNADPRYPALATTAKTYNPTGQYFEYDGSYLRLQSIELGYSFPKNMIQPLRLDNLKLYINGRNLFLWTKMPNDGVGFDQPNNNYPTKKQVNLGLNIRF